MTRTLGILAVTALLLTGCSTTTPDDAYLETIRESAPELEAVDDTELIGLGHDICDMFDQRGFNDGMIELVSLAKNSGINAGGAGRLAGAATGAFCTEHAENF